MQLSPIQPKLLQIDARVDTLASQRPLASQKPQASSAKLAESVPQAQLLVSQLRLSLSVLSLGSLR